MREGVGLYQHACSATHRSASALLARSSMAPRRVRSTSSWRASSAARCCAACPCLRVSAVRQQDAGTPRSAATRTDSDVDCAAPASAVPGGAACASASAILTRRARVSARSGKAAVCFAPLQLQLERYVASAQRAHDGAQARCVACVLRRHCSERRRRRQQRCARRPRRRRRVGGCRQSAAHGGRCCRAASGGARGRDCCGQFGPSRPAPSAVGNTTSRAAASLPPP